MARPPFRRQSGLDLIISHVDHALHNIFCEQPTSREYPAEHVKEDAQLTDDEMRLAAGLMRVNHAGEIAAQALYQGQSITARDPALRSKLRQASIEESDHLNWCRRRLDELGEQPSKLDPFWYMGSIAIGIAAGIAGDRWNLGFLAETEHQVVRHLDGHKKRLPEHDTKSRSIVAQMREDEMNHAGLAEELGAAEVPETVKTAMRFAAKIMTSVAERI